MGAGAQRQAANDGDVSLNKTLERRTEEAIREEVSIVSYDPQWPELFNDEASYLRRRLPASLVTRIEHFGSTAVPGLAAKPIVDILVGVKIIEDARE